MAFQNAAYCVFYSHQDYSTYQGQYEQCQASPCDYTPGGGVLLQQPNIQQHFAQHESMNMSP